MNRRHLALATGFALLSTATAAILYAAQDHNHPDLSFAQKTFSGYTTVSDGSVTYEEAYNFGNMPAESWMPQLDKAATDAGFTSFPSPHRQVQVYIDGSGRRLMVDARGRHRPVLTYHMHEVPRVQAILGPAIMRLRGRYQTAESSYRSPDGTTETTLFERSNREPVPGEQHR
ncbi:MAG: hypothetical protein QOJ65_1142 [Fimbriimonadaceae bacterium]|jgi:hypothetical protein|nr:hypothetical protein [Fimbriimonadaceae bacterium]